jgi:tight adherence protein B
LTGVALAIAAGYGTFLLFTARVFGWRGIGIGPGVRPAGRRIGNRARAWFAHVGLGDVRPRDFAVAIAAVFGLVALLIYALFGGVVIALVVGAFAATFPLTVARQRRRTRRAVAQQAWPRMIEEIRVLTSSIGRSIPQALFEVGREAPIELRPAFATAHREWLISTDFARTIAVLKERMGDATADAACETLLVAHELGGAELDTRLADLAADRREDTQYRKDAQARQAGVRFARRFVLLVPLGMAFAGLAVGTGRDAYESPSGQLAVVVAIVMIAACWFWAGRLMRLPDEQRVFDER